MKYKHIIIAVSVLASTAYAGQVFSQDNGMSRVERNQKDSLETVRANEQQLQQTDDEKRMADAKIDRKQTRAKAKHAQRIEDDANDAARESRQAVRTERRAQKSRKQATRQSDKAAKARDKSDRN
jgi:hypothetical protein